MIEKGISVKKIYASLIQGFDYKGTYGAIRAYVTKIRKKKKREQMLQLPL